MKTSDPEIYDITKTIIGNRKRIHTISPGNGTGGCYPLYLVIELYMEQVGKRDQRDQHDQHQVGDRTGHVPGIF